MTVHDLPDEAQRAASAPSPSSVHCLAADGSAARGPLPATALTGMLARVADFAAALLGADGAEICVTTAAGTVVAAADGRAGTQAEPGRLASIAAATAETVATDEASAFAATAALPAVRAGIVRAYLGVPLVGEGGDIFGGLCVFTGRPRAWTTSDIEMLRQFAESAAAQVGLSALASEYEARRLRWDVAIEAAGIGSFDWDLRTGKLVWDEQLLRLFGFDESTFDFTIESFNARVHPDDIDQVNRQLAKAIEECSDFFSEYRIVRPDLGERWIEARGRALAGEGGTAARLLGAAYDTTDKRRGEIRLTRVLESMSAAFYSLDREWRFAYVNAEAERLLGRQREQLVGRVLWDLFPAAANSDFDRVYRETRETGVPATFEAYYPAPLDGWYELRVWPGADDLLWVFFLDITQRRRAIDAAERSAERLALLASVSTELATTLDAEVAVARLAHIVVPDLADWCIVTLVDEAGVPRDVGWWHADAQARPLVERYAVRRLEAMDERSFPARALRSGRSELLRNGAAVTIASTLAPGEAQGLITSLAPESALVLPLRGRDRTVGLLMLYRGRGRERFDDDDLITAEEVARRAGSALDNARLYDQQRRRSEELQRSLLSAPPAADYLEIAVRYEPAGEAAQVGGDWYDAFLQPDGGTVLVIGDVVGHDIAAAAAMGQVRGLLRGIGYTTGAGPAEVLTRLDQSLQGLQVETTATAVVARLEQDPGQRRAARTSLRWSNAGHPPPVVIHPDGPVVLLGEAAPDLLLGIDPRTGRVEHKLELERGTTVMLYTDGLVERRGKSLDEGLGELCALLRELADAPLEALCDEVLARLSPSSNDDDVALVAVRLHPEDRPRPPEAGPRRMPPGAAAPPESDIR